MSEPAERISGRDQRRMQKEEQIVTAAAELFFKEGYGGTSMDRIVEAASVSKRTLYNYYKSKDEIFIDVIQRQLGAIYQNFEPGELDNLNLAQQLQKIGEHILQLANAEQTLALFRNLVAESQRFPKLAHHFLEQSLERVIAGIAELCERQAETANLVIADPHAAAEHFLDMVTGSAYNRVIFGTTLPMNNQKIKARTQQAVDYFFRAFRR
ncbi:TetR/AcrR family transcriptional regulator [Halioxenophilus sp. WMMB6]|uniref:TetR/AcrR family transcriptional regulator n=1 Tax=Halioxenophilus sp. WMMB6 TaxID=3073815 RepID=UPI00295F4374|nr:TetR/AcrR family transcriptional regulator [Halioxenophilus sp. WMMB6]